MKRNILTALFLSLALWATGQNFDTSHSYVSKRIYLNEEGTKYIDNVTYLDGYYRRGSLDKVTTTDEDGHITETFTDNQGKTILMVAVNGNECPSMRTTMNMMSCFDVVTEL